MQLVLNRKIRREDVGEVIDELMEQIERAFEDAGSMSDEDGEFRVEIVYAWDGFEE